MIEQIRADEIDEKFLTVNEHQLNDSTDDTVDVDRDDETHQHNDDDEVDDDEDIETVETDELDDVIHINLDQIQREIDEIRATGERDETDDDLDIDIRELDDNDETDETDSFNDDNDDVIQTIELERDDVEYWNDENDDVDDTTLDEQLEDDEMLFQICSDCSYLQESLTIQIEWFVQNDEIDENDELDTELDVIVDIQLIDDLDEMVLIDDVQWLYIEQKFINEWLTIDDENADCDDVRIVHTKIEEIVVLQIDVLEMIEAVWYVKSLIIKNKKQWRMLDV